MNLTRLAEDCGPDEYCPAVDMTDQQTLVFTGSVVRYEGLRAGPDEQSVELPIHLVKEALRVLDARRVPG